MEEKLFMVFTQTLYHKITKAFWGPKFSMHMMGNLSGALSYYWGDKGMVESGMHVGHLAFCMARVMGCNPIILVGMDLAFTEDKFHAESIETNVNISTSDQITDEEAAAKSRSRCRLDSQFVILDNCTVERNFIAFLTPCVCKRIGTLQFIPLNGEIQP